MLKQIILPLLLRWVRGLSTRMQLTLISAVVVMFWVVTHIPDQPRAQHVPSEVSGPTTVAISLGAEDHAEQTPAPELEQEIVTRQADGVWVSAGGLRYGSDPSSKFDTRIDHVMAHTRENDRKRKHSVFVVKSRDGLLQLLDEAWGNRGPPVQQGGANGRDVYVVDMKRAIGEKGQRFIKMIIEAGARDVVTAYPVHGGR